MTGQELIRELGGIIAATYETHRVEMLVLLIEARITSIAVHSISLPATSHSIFSVVTGPLGWQQISFENILAAVFFFVFPRLALWGWQKRPNRIETNFAGHRKNESRGPRVDRRADPPYWPKPMLMVDLQYTTPRDQSHLYECV